MVSPSKKVIIAKHCGFCPGVKKAIDLVLELAQKGKSPIYTLGPLIHNAHVIQTLEEKGIHAVNSLSEIKNGADVLVIRAHGITPEAEAEIRSAGIEVIDGTCPLVKNVHKVIAKYADKGYSTVIVGDDGHAEVVGLLGYTKGKGFVVANPEQAKKLPSFDKVNIVAQTTQEEKNFKNTAEIVSHKAKEYVISDTICMPTKQRQKETVEFASNADLVIVVGGKNSANTTRLAKMCRRLCAGTIHIESEKELPSQQILSAEKIVITSGASTPGWVTQRVADFVSNIKKPKSKIITKPLLKLWELLVDSGLHSSFAAVCLTYASMKLQSIKPELKLLLLAWFFVLSLTVINRAWQKVGTGDKEKEWLFKKHRFLSTLTGCIVGISAMAISFSMGIKIFALVALFWFLGIIYPARHIFKIKLAGTFPASKDIVTALGWAFVCAWIPAFYKSAGFQQVNYTAFAFAGVLVFIRSALLGISSIHSDLIVGKETLFKTFGKKNSYIILFTLFAVSATVMSIEFFTSKSITAFALLSASCYMLIMLLSYFRGKILKNIWAETLLDGQFFVIAGFAYITAF
ncbi:MAG TPA: 4-hydroxy-3-methylbut-2-enyl diphosphate reductase [Elusimicrobiales bacterium]|nr:4-hydroxy-3-methylbut-2-enyl diphosphate reductase [Elusimicrobiales bacterium]